jgi:hypothetical protein
MRLINFHIQETGSTGIHVIVLENARAKKGE